MPTPRKTRAQTVEPPPSAADQAVIDAEMWQAPAGGSVLRLPMHADDADEDPPPLTAADRVQAMLQGASGDDRARVKLYKITDKGKYGLCGEFTPEDYEAMDSSSLLARWGAGEFVVRLYGTVPGKSGSAGYGVRAHEQLTILEDRSATNAAAMPSGLSETLNAMAATQTRLLEALTTRPAAPDPQAQMMQMLAMMKLMREAMGGDAPARRERGLIEQLADLKALREMAGELANGEKAEPPDPLTAALPSLLEIIKGSQQAQANTAQGTGANMPPVQLPAAMAGPMTEPLPHPGAQENPAMPTINDPAQALALLQKKLKTIMALAAANVDPEEGAAILYEHLPDELVDVLRTETWFESLQQFAPEAAPHREWLDKARTIFLGWIDNGHPDDADGEDDPDNPDTAA